MTSVPPINLNEAALAARVAQTLSHYQRLAYAHIDADLTIKQTSSNFRVFMNDANLIPIEKESFHHLLWEFVGGHHRLQAIIDGKSPPYLIEHLRHEKVDGSIGSFTFQVTLLDQQKPQNGLLLLIQEQSELPFALLQLAQAHKAIRRMKRLTSILLAKMAHDLRTPLSIIHLHADMLLDLVEKQQPPTHAGQLRIKESSSLKMVKAQTEVINRLITDLLTLDQIEQGTLVMNITPFPLAKVIEEVLEEMHLLITARGHMIKTNLPDDPLIMSADSRRIGQILYHLLENALKYTDNGKCIELGAKITETSIVLSVKDEGYGMVSEQIEALFEPYYEDENALNGEIKKLGMGLYIVKALADAHGAQLEVESQLRQGSTFTLFFPRSANFQSP